MPLARYHYQNVMPSPRRILLTRIVPLRRRKAFIRNRDKISSFILVDQGNKYKIPPKDRNRFPLNHNMARAIDGFQIS